MNNAKMTARLVYLLPNGGALMNLVFLGHQCAVVVDAANRIQPGHNLSEMGLSKAAAAIKAVRS